MFFRVQKKHLLENPGRILTGFSLYTSYSGSPKYQLWDLSNVKKILLSNEDIVAFTKQDAAAAKINSNMIIAIVASSDLIYGLSRMWEANSDSSPFKSMVFRNIEDAEKWIDEMINMA